jgi:hypothetical protein
METKRAGPEGRVEAVIATLDVIDADGDVVRRGAIKDGTEVPICVQHSCPRDAGNKVGTARMRTDGDRVIAGARFNMSSKPGRAAYAMASSPDAEWSWGYAVRNSRKATVEGREVRELLDLELVELSVVLQGASVGTGTIAAKTATQLDPAEVDAVVKRSEKLLARIEADDAARSEGLRGVVARDAAQRAVEWLTGGRQHDPPLVKFFDDDGKRAGYFDPADSDSIYISRALKLDAIPRVVGHETSHWLSPWDATESEYNKTCGRIVHEQYWSRFQPVED